MNRENIIDENIIDEDTYVVHENTFSINNAIYISNKIHNIPDYDTYFCPIISSSPLDQNFHKYDSNVIAQCNETTIHNECDISNHSCKYNASNIQYQLITYSCNFQEYLSLYEVYDNSILDPSFNYMSVYFTLLESIELLNSHDIVIFLLSNSSLKFDILNESVLLCDFTNSLYIPSIRQDCISMYFHKGLINGDGTETGITEHTSLCFDVFFISYILWDENDNDEITEKFLCQCVNQFTVSRTILHRDSIYKWAAYFIGYNKQLVIRYLLQFAKSWSIYTANYYFYLLNYSSDNEHFFQSSISTQLEDYLHCHPKERITEFTQFLRIAC